MAHSANVIYECIEMRCRSIRIRLIPALVGALALTSCTTVRSVELMSESHNCDSIYISGKVVQFRNCDSVRGSGQVISQPRDVGGFTGVELAGTGTLTIEQTGTESLTIQAEDNILPLLTSEVSGSILRLDTRDDAIIYPTKPIVYHLTVKDLGSIKVSGSGDVTAPNLIATNLTVVISGSGNVTVGGTADIQTIRISGSGSYSAEDLASTAVTAKVSGNGNAVVKVSDTLDAAISGIGSITYIGNPTVNQRISGLGTITKR